MNNVEGYTGLLLNKKNITLHRSWFKQMCDLLGIKVLYRAPIEGKHYDGYGELNAYCEAPQLIHCIFDDHPTQSTMKKLGWIAELNESTTLIHVPYDLKGLQAGALFEIPNGIDDSGTRLFKVLKMKVSPIYPASVTCELGPVLKSTVELHEIHDFRNSDFNVLIDPEEEEE